MFDNLSIVKTPKAARRLFPAALWKVRTREKKIYLTFDDGPIAEATPIVLDELKKYNAKASFFCIGKNVAANPNIYQRILAEGHLIGNHTQDHLNGWKVQNDTYFENIEQCAEQLEAVEMSLAEVSHHTPTKSMAAKQTQIEVAEVQHKFFRPPYGKLTLAQYNKLKKLYKVVMWDVLSFDFDLKVTKEQVLDNVLKNAASGSIIVFHDSLKAMDKMLYALPQVLEHYSSLGYKFETLPD
jgi:peptidoglycan/xylan/chitin deacetylase (PgdA/CDA1 family)